jgi:hypothetical protein
MDSLFGMTVFTGSPAFLLLIESGPFSSSYVRFVLASLAGGIACSLTDWLFMGSDWLYRRFDRHPEIWRPSGRFETRAIILSSPLPFITCTAFVLLSSRLHLHSFHSTMAAAVTIWGMAPLPLTIANALFMKISRGVMISHLLGWLAKLLIAALSVSLIAR